MPARRLVPLILLNVIISATVVLAILFWWDSRRSIPVEPAVPTSAIAAVPSPESTSQAETSGEANIDVQDAEDNPTVYVVQTGDNLGKISNEFDVSMADLMTANDLSDPNFLQVGQELIIPLGGIVTPTIPPLPSETPWPNEAPTPIPTQLPSDGEAIVSIVEVIGAGDIEAEAIAIENSGSRPMALLGWRLMDESGQTYVFDQVTLFGDGASIQVHTAAGDEGPSDLYWGLDQPIWQSDETATLFDAEGTVRDFFVVGDG